MSYLPKVGANPARFVLQTKDLTKGMPSSLCPDSIEVIMS